MHAIDTRLHSAALRAALIATLVFSAAFRLITIDRPFVYDDEATGSFYGVLARNELRLGVGTTYGIPVETVGRRPDGGMTFYPDHPPLVPLLIMLTYAVFGVGEWQTRLPTAIASLLTVYAIFKVVRAAGNGRAGVIAAALFALMPMTLYFGGQPEVVGMPLVLFAVLAAGAYIAAHREPRPRRVLVLVVIFALAAASDWPAFVLVPVFTAHWLFTQPRRAWGPIAIFTGAAGALFIALYVYIATAASLPWIWMIPLLAHRTAIGIKPPFTAGSWLKTAWVFNRHVHTIPILAGAALWLTVERVRPAARPNTRRGASTLTYLLLAWGTLHVVIGRQGVFNHEWWWWPLSPGLALASALFLDRAVQSAEMRGRRRAAASAVAMAICGFGTWSTATTVRQLYPGKSSEFTPAELGAAIRIAAPLPDEVVLLVWSGEDPQVWFYGDRPVRANVWSTADLMKSIDRRTVDLVFSDVEPWPARPAGLVFPTAYRRELKALHEYLDGHYRRVDNHRAVEAFDIYDLRRAPNTHQQ